MSHRDLGGTSSQRLISNTKHSESKVQRELFINLNYKFLMEILLEIEIFRNNLYAKQKKARKINTK